MPLVRQTGAGVASNAHSPQRPYAPTHRSRVSGLLPWLVLTSGMVASYWLFAVIMETVEREARLRFERRASDITHAIEARIRSYSEIMHGLQALLATQNPVTRLQFHRYVSALDLPRRYPGYDVVNYALHVRHEERTQFEETVRRDTSLDPRGYPQFTIKPRGDRSEYFVIVYVEPMAGFEFAFGLDLAANSAVMGADSNALTALQHAARDTGALTASGRPIRIKRRGKEYVGLAARLAIYRSDMPIGSVQEKRAAYLGSVGAGFNVEELMRQVVSPEFGNSVRFVVYDVGSATAPKPDTDDGPWILFDSDQISTAQAARSADAFDQDTHFTSNLPVQFGGRLWQVRFSAEKRAIIDRIDYVLPWIMLAGGLLSSALLCAVFYSLASSRSRAVAMAAEITRDLRNSEQGLRASTEQLQALSRRLVDAQETERRQLSRELHDRVGQNLTALSISVGILQGQIAQNDHAALRTRLEDTARLLESTTEMIETVMLELRPPMLDDYGLLPALQWYANDYARRTGIQVSARANEPIGRLDLASEIALFRIAQEALNNVAKHARASTVRIVLARGQQHFTMAITDDGAGLDAGPKTEARRRPGLGMVTMRERTQALGGDFEIGPAPGRGTAIVVRIPC